MESQYLIRRLRPSTGSAMIILLGVLSPNRIFDTYELVRSSELLVLVHITYQRGHQHQPSTSLTAQTEMKRNLQLSMVAVNAQVQIFGSQRPYPYE